MAKAPRRKALHGPSMAILFSCRMFATVYPSASGTRFMGPVSPGPAGGVKTFDGGLDRQIQGTLVEGMPLPAISKVYVPGAGNAKVADAGNSSFGPFSAAIVLDSGDFHPSFPAAHAALPWRRSVGVATDGSKCKRRLRFQRRRLVPERSGKSQDHRFTILPSTCGEIVLRAVT
jgi:hypothetical protein